MASSAGAPLQHTSCGWFSEKDMTTMYFVIDSSPDSSSHFLNNVISVIYLSKDSQLLVFSIDILALRFIASHLG